MKENIIHTKSFTLAIETIKICKELEMQNEYVLSKQLKRSGTAPGALVREAEHAESRKDFIHKMSIALKEANESKYWIRIITSSDYLDKGKTEKALNICLEVIKILASIIKTSKLKAIK